MQYGRSRVPIGAKRDEDEMRHPTSRMLFAYWDGLRGERSAPDRGEVEPGAIRHILADTFILEMEAGVAQFRLAGTRLCALFGSELKGRIFAGLWKEDGRAEIQRLVGAVQDDAAGIVGGIVGETQSGRTVDLEILLLPLRHHGKTHSRMLGAISPAAIPVWLGMDPIVDLRTVSLRIVWPSGRRTPLDLPADTSQDRRRRLVVHQGGRS